MDSFNEYPAICVVIKNGVVETILRNDCPDVQRVTVEIVDLDIVNDVVQNENAEVLERFSKQK